MIKSTLKLAFFSFLAVTVFAMGCSSNNTNNNVVDNETETADTIQNSPLDENMLVQLKDISLVLPKGTTSNKTSDGLTISLSENAGGELKLYTETVEPELADIYERECDEELNIALNTSLEGQQCINDNNCTFIFEHNYVRYLFLVEGWNEKSTVQKANLIKLIKDSQIADNPAS